MKKLFWKIFIPILIAMVGLILASILLVARSGQEQRHHLHGSVIELYEEASDVLRKDDIEGLTQWLKFNNDDLVGVTVFITRRGERDDLLGRLLPPRQELLERLRERRGEREGRRGRYNDSRYPNLFANDGTQYRFHLARKPMTIGSLIRNESIFWPLLLSMIGLSALVSFLIARQISKPIQRLSLGAQRIAGGNLKERVKPELVREDEIGQLASDFDNMAEQVDGLLTTQKKLLRTQRRMLRDISHELRSPLARMQVALGLAEKRGGDAIKPELARIETEAETLNEMIGKVLSLVRLQNLSVDTSSLQWEEHNVSDVLSSIIKNANYEAQEKGVSVELSGDTNTTIKLIPDLFKSAVENIIRNAIQYSESNTQVNVNVTKDASKLRLSIQDQGPGVPEKTLEKLFEPFYRVSDVREHNKGTGGVGLAIAKQVAKLHKGRIWAENKNGLCVHLELPLS